MGSSAKKTCGNASCGTTITQEWKRGWPLRSGDFAVLCFTCGTAYENSIYCDTFHSDESGWRECSACSKRLHCGCIASEALLHLLDYGGIGCSNCVRNSSFTLQIQNHDIPNGFSTFSLHNSDNLEPKLKESRATGNTISEGKLAQLCRLMGPNETNALPQSEGGESRARLGKFGQEIGLCLSTSTQPSSCSSKFNELEKLRSMLAMSDIHGSLAQPSLSMSLGAPSFPTNIISCAAAAANDKEVDSPVPSFQQGAKPRPILAKPSKLGPSLSPDMCKVSPPEPRIARPPAEGRGKNQLLPRYWPRITDQELQQLSGDLNSKIVPLFEKVLSASDAGRIGRLVLPKACAEAYFPPISQSEGLQIRIQDVKGREWTFQFRFWPNNNSRMYVLEGVTPCIQSLQLRAGDTITFSRIDPGGKLVLGYRKATNNSMDTQDEQSPMILNPTSSGENFLTTDMDFGWNKGESHGISTTTSSLQQGPPSAATVDKKKARNIGPKNKRLLINNEDARELRLTWEEAQDLLRPPPNVLPTIVSIDDQEFEEYDEPPVFGKKTLFTTRPSGRQDQWAQCDDCSKWRKLPVEALLPAKWTCSENIWESSRSTCSADEETNPRDMDNFIRLNGDVKKRRTREHRRASQESEPSGLDALASAAVMGENTGDIGESSVGATTKHPRHRPGCTCIVCIQPPSGKGKHKPNCMCNVCLTVKRRFKTLMMRKKKRQSEREVEEAQKKTADHKDGPEIISNSSTMVDVCKTEPLLASPRQIDLNYFPNREEMHLETHGLSAMHLPEFSDNGSKSRQQQCAGSSSNSLSRSNGESLKQLSDHEAFLASISWDHGNKGT